MQDKTTPPPTRARAGRINKLAALASYAHFIQGEELNKYSQKVDRKLNFNVSDSLGSPSYLPKIFPTLLHEAMLIKEAARRH